MSECIISYNDLVKTVHEHLKPKPLVIAEGLSFINKNSM